MKKEYNWDEYRAYLESSLNKDFVDAYYEELFSEEKWNLYTWRYEQLVIPVMKKLAPHIDHEAMWEQTKDAFTKELVLYCWNVSKYRTSKEHHLGYKKEDVEHLVFDILTAEGSENIRRLTWAEKMLIQKMLFEILERAFSKQVAHELYVTYNKAVFREIEYSEWYQKGEDILVEKVDSITATLINDAGKLMFEGEVEQE